MELWIRSQDREIMLSNPILIVDNDRILTPKNDYRDTHLILGHYKTKERALEVLDEIQNILSGKCILKSYDNVTPEFSENTIIKPCEVYIEQLNTYVYEMPED